MDFDFDYIFNKSDSNYVEFVLLSNHINDDQNEVDIYETEFSKEMFENVWRRLAKDESTLQYFQKEYKEYIVDDVTYEHSKNNNIDVRKKQPVDFRKVGNIAVCMYKKNKLNILSFPSSTNVNVINYVVKLTFRVNNRIYINFETKVNQSRKYYTIYVNYNHDNTIDQKLYKQLLLTTIQKLVPTLQTSQNIHI